MSSILLIEDEENSHQLLNNVLHANGYQTECVRNGQEGLRLAVKKDYNLILMGFMLPLKRGEEILRNLRRIKSTPIIVLSDESTMYNRIQLLRFGADECIKKPFTTEEAMWRIETVLRRAQGIASVLSFRDMRMDTVARRVFIGEREMSLTETEYYILELMLSEPKEVFSKKELFENVTGEEYWNGENTMNVHISNLRRKIAQITQDAYIETVYRVGYRLR